MVTLYELSVRLIDQTPLEFTRYLYEQINWGARLIAITGSRGTGKTTLLRQYAKRNYDYMSGKALYVSLDHIWFASHALFELADSFVKDGGELLLLDEVHKYDNWCVEIKNIYDFLPSLKVVFTGSSLLKIEKGEADLSRRVVQYHLQGMSFREYAKYESGLDLPQLSLDDILSRHVALATETTRGFKPLPLFRKYLRYGYYPYYKEDESLYHQRLLATVNTVLEVDLPAVDSIERVTINRVKKLLSVLAQIVPCVPNISDLSKKVEATRISLMKYLVYLADAKLIMMLEKESAGYKKMEKPEKLYLGNTNLCYALADENANIGNVRETFFMNQIQAVTNLYYSSKTDFLVNGISFEVGGKNKTLEQIKDLPDSYVAADDIEIGHGRIIPLWLFGLMY